MKTVYGSKATSVRVQTCRKIFVMGKRDYQIHNIKNGIYFKRNGICSARQRDDSNHSVCYFGVANINFAYSTLGL